MSTGRVHQPPDLDGQPNIVPRLIAFVVMSLLVIAIISTAVLRGGGDKPPAQGAAPRPSATVGPRLSASASDAAGSSGSRTSAPTPVPSVQDATPGLAVASGCREATYSVLGDSPIGRRYVAGDALEVAVAFETDGCVAVGGVFTGYHSPGSRYYDYYCPESCGPRLATRFAYVEPARLSARSGVATIRARVGTFPPENLSSPPDINGFTLCQVSITFTDGKFGGSYVEKPLGTFCAGTSPTRPR